MNAERPTAAPRGSAQIDELAIARVVIGGEQFVFISQPAARHFARLGVTPGRP